MAAREKLQRVREWASGRGLPDDLRQQIDAYYSDKLSRKEETGNLDASVLEQLPSSLRSKVAHCICLPAISQVHILRELAPDVQLKVSELFRPVRLPAGEELCQQGDVSDCLWILADGCVQAVRYKEGSITLDTRVLDNPQLLGEEVLIGDIIPACQLRSWTLRTVAPCRLWRLSLQDVWPLVRMFPDIQEAALEYIRFKVVRSMGCMSVDERWCGLAEVLLCLLQDKTGAAEAEQVTLELARSNFDDGTLAVLIGQLVSLCIQKPGTQLVMDQAAAEAARAAAKAAKASAEAARQKKDFAAPAAAGAGVGAGAAADAVGGGVGGQRMKHGVNETFSGCDGCQEGQCGFCGMPGADPTMSASAMALQLSLLLQVSTAPAMDSAEAAAAAAAAAFVGSPAFFATAANPPQQQQPGGTNSNYNYNIENGPNGPSVANGTSLNVAAGLSPFSAAGELLGAFPTTPYGAPPMPYAWKGPGADESMAPSVGSSTYPNAGSMGNNMPTAMSVGMGGGMGLNPSGSAVPSYGMTSMGSMLTSASIPMTPYGYNAAVARTMSLAPSLTPPGGTAPGMPIMSRGVGLYDSGRTTSSASNWVRRTMNRQSVSRASAGVFYPGIGRQSVWLQDLGKMSVQPGDQF